MANQKGSSGTRKYVKRKRTARKYPRNKSITPRAPRMTFAPIGAQRLVKHAYYQEILVDAAAGVCSDFVFSANGLYAPPVTSAGHQPYAFDTMTSMYNHYTVIGSKISVRAASNNTFPFWMAVELGFVSTSQTAQTSTQILERPGVVARQFGGSSTIGSLGMVKGFSARKFFGKSDIVGGADYRGNDASNPAEGAFFHVMVIPQGSNNLDAQTLMVRIDYTAVWTEPKILAQS